MSGFLITPPVVSQDPYPHFSGTSAFGLDASEEVLKWLETDAPWKLKIADFYEQYEFSFLDCQLPERIQALFTSERLSKLRRQLEQIFNTHLREECDVVAHKLISGQRIRIHNDFIPGRETHRLLIQLNRGWQDSFGGILLLFGSNDPLDIRKALRPVHDSYFSFAISSESHHAVTPISESERYTLVLSFYAHES